MSSRSGFVYLVAMLVVLVVSGIAMAMASGGGLRLRAGNDLAARTQCRAAALGVLRAVVNDLDTTLASTGTPALATVLPGGEGVGDCTVLLLGRDPAATATAFGLIPEAGCIDVNHAPAEVLAALPGMTPEIAAAIIDWRDADDVPDAGGGAERNDGAYAGAAVAYAPRNAPIETLAELRLVRGVTDALWFGEDADRNGHLDPGEDGDGDGRLDPGLVDLLALDNREPLTAPDGSARTGIRRITDLRARLIAVLGPERGAALGANLQALQPFANRLDLIAALELPEDEAAELWPCLIGDEGRVGLLDAASCREEALAAAIGADLAKLVIAARPTAAGNPGPGWLAKALGRDQARLVGGRLTVGSYQFRADLLAIRNDGAGWARLEARIDGSTGISRVTSIRPAESLGWPLPWATPGQLRRTPAPRDLAAFLTTGQQ